jgi:hypothetical protein
VALLAGPAVSLPHRKMQNEFANRQAFSSFRTLSRLSDFLLLGRLICFSLFPLPITMFPWSIAFCDTIRGIYVCRSSEEA